MKTKQPAGAKRERKVTLEIPVETMEQLVEWSRREVTTEIPRATIADLVEESRRPRHRTTVEIPIQTMAEIVYGDESEAA